MKRVLLTAIAVCFFAVVAKSQPPQIFLFNPPSGHAGMFVTISGSNFDNVTPSANLVMFNGVAAVVGNATTSQIIVQVPAGATTGPITVTVAGQTATSPSNFVMEVQPAIINFNPIFGPPGTIVTINGTDFSILPGGNSVKFNGVVTPQIISATATQIVAKVPSTATSGPITVSLGTLVATSPFAFTVTSPPIIDGFTPTSGPPGTEVTIDGANFHSAVFSGSNTLTFNGEPATVTSATDTRIVAIVPAAASTGTIEVKVSFLIGTSSLPFTVTHPPPTIIDVTPHFGAPGTEVTITGTNFNLPPLQNTVEFNGISTSVTALSGTTIKVFVPGIATSGPVTVRTLGGSVTTSFDFNVVQPPPTITSFNPTSGAVGTPVTIRGTNFDGISANNTVEFNGVPATVTGSGAITVSALVPPGAIDGPITVTVLGQPVTSAAPFTVITPPPTITSFTPDSGPINTPVTINGTNFNIVAGNNTVKFNGVTATVTAASATSITANVPAGTVPGPGPITVIVNAKTATSTSPFTVTVAPTIDNFTPTSGVAGTPVTVTGTNFSTSGGNTVKFNGVTATVTTATATSITANVPVPAATGVITVSVNGQTATSSSPFIVTVPDITPPTVNNSTPGSVDNGQPVTVSVSLSDTESGIASAAVLYRYISAGSNFTTLPLNQTGGQNYSATIPASSSNDLGVEYKFDITNGAGLKNTETLYVVRVLISGSGLTIPYSSAGVGISAYRIVAVPLQLTAASVGNVFDELGAIDNTMWRMWYYSNGQNSELNLSSTITPGNGYWLISRNDPGAISSGPGQTVTATFDAPFQVDLKTGWNQIGNPYNFVLNWADVQAANVGLPGLRRYVDTFVDATNLDKMEGGFVHVTADRTISIPVTKDKSLNGGRVNAEQKVDEVPLDQKNWQVHLHLSHGNMRNEIGGFGMNARASEGLDVYDGVTMPRFFGRWLEINYASSSQGTSLSKNVVPTSANYVWEFKTETSEADPAMTLTWDNSYFGADGPELILWDDARQYAVNMRTTSSYVYDPQTSGSFRIFFGSRAFVDDQQKIEHFSLVRVWPNPADKSGEVTFSISVPDDEGQTPLAIDVIDALGRKVWSFGKTLPSGNHEVKWRLGDDEASGLYIVRVKSGLSTDFSRLILRNK